MNKYLSVFKISFQQEFAYRLNFIMWRVRNVLQIFLVFFLWDTIFNDPSRVVFGYDRAKILTYVFGIVIIRAVVISARSIDIAGELSRGDLVNYLTKPVSYFKYWFTRDLSSKALNLIFAIVEIPILFLILKPPFFFQTNPLYLAIFLISLIIAVILFFNILFLFNMFPMWYPDQAWGPTFLIMIFTEFLGGGVFPIDILPSAIQKILYLTPFPYLIFAPLQIYLGKYDLLTTFRMVFVSLVWTIVLVFAVRKVWTLGLKVYKSEGK